MEIYIARRTSEGFNCAIAYDEARCNILDEPCSALDPVARRNFIRFLDKLSKKKSIPAIIMATHYLEEIPPTFTHALILKKGAVMASGKIDEVINSKNLSRAYGAKCNVSKRKGFFSLSLEM